MRLFGTDGVRGRAGDFLTVEMAMKFAMAAGIYFQKHSTTKKILLGKDTRRSGYMIENAIVAGLTSVGYNVIQVGPMPTPAIAFLTENMRCDCGIMISASHNSFEDNGIKFFDANGNKLSEEIEDEIEAIYHNETVIAESQVTHKHIGKARRIDDVIGRYIVQLKNSFPTDLNLQGMRIVLDTANGAAYRVGPTVLEELGAEVIVLHNKPDGFNINEDCGATHTRDLQSTVKLYRADIGFALDGDADRLVVVDENGETIDGDLLLGAIAIYLYNNGKLKGDGIAATVMSNQALEDELSKLNLKLYRSKVGDKYVLDAMKSNGLNFGGEQSGHVILNDYAKTGDGLVTALQTLALILSNGKIASKALRKFKLYPQKLENIIIEEKKPLDKISGLDEELKQLDEKHIRHLIRYSGTENKLRILLECKNEKELDKAMKQLVEFFKKALNA